MRVACLFVALSISTFACQEECRTYITKGDAQLSLSDGDQSKSLGDARVVIRSAESNGKFPETLCSFKDQRVVKGKVIRKIRTAQNGTFSLNNLRDGWYWVTYDDPANGESFLVEKDSQATNDERLTLSVNDFRNACYLVDVERNVTKPPGWRSPVRAEKSK
jgi:hypothetical protein